MVSLLLRLRQCRDLALQVSEAYDKHHYCNLFRLRQPVNFQVGDFFMVRTVPYPRVGPKTDTNGSATRLLLIWDGPHRITRVFATTYCEIQDRHDQGVHVVNVARLLPCTFFRPCSIRIEKVLRSVLPQPPTPVTPPSSAEAKEEEKSADAPTVLVAVLTPADIAILCN
jgi:hypothetical protein